MVKIYSLVVDNDSGTSTHLFYTEAERDARCQMIMASAWSDNGWPEPVPADWRDAWEKIEAAGADFWIVMAEHEINPALLVAA